MDSNHKTESQLPHIDSTKTPQNGGSKWGIFPTTVDLLAVLGIFFVAQLLSIAITYLLGYGWERSALESADSLVREAAESKAAMFSMVSYSITMTITILGTLILRTIRGGKAPIAKFSVLGFNPSVLLWGMVLLLSVTVVCDPLMGYLPNVPQVQGRGWAMILTLTVIAPIAEELLCRGIVLESVRAKSGVWAACAISAVFFAVLHMHITVAVNALVVGLILSYLYIRTGSLFAPILLHAFNNALAYILVWLGLENVTLSELAGDRVIYFSIYVVAVFVLIVSGVKIIRQLARIRKAQKIVDLNDVKL